MNLCNFVKDIDYHIDNLDIDGVLSGILINSINPNMKIGGFSNSNDLIYIVDGANEKNTIQIDIHTNNFKVKSIDQHILFYNNIFNENKINPNISFGKEWERSLNYKYNEKYPFSTALLILYLADIDGVKFNFNLKDKVINDIEIIDIIGTADSTFRNFANSKYSGNCVNWSENIFTKSSLLKEFFDFIKKTNPNELIIRQNRVQNYLSNHFDGYDRKGFNEIENSDIRGIYGFLSNVLKLNDPMENTAILKLNKYKGKRIFLTNLNDIDYSKFNTHAYIFGKNKNNNFSGTIFNKIPEKEKIII